MVPGAVGSNPIIHPINQEDRTASMARVAAVVRASSFSSEPRRRPRGSTGSGAGPAPRSTKLNYVTINLAHPGRGCCKVISWRCGELTVFTAVTTQAWKAAGTWARQRSREGGGIGRRARLRIWWLSRAGSSPAPRTNTGKLQLAAFFARSRRELRSRHFYASALWQHKREFGWKPGSRTSNQSKRP